MKKIRTAVFPVAGLGSRFLPATKAIAKEMLPIVDKPLIQYAVEEAREAGITSMIFVTGRTKRSIADHFDKAYELEVELEQAGKTELLKLAQSVTPAGVTCAYVRQPGALGLGHAVLCAENLVGDEPFAVLLADDLIDGKPGALKQMVQAYEEHQASVLAVENVPRDKTGSYGIVSAERIDDHNELVNGIVEKPAPADAPSTLAVVGRYILEPQIFEELRNIPRGKGGEYQLTDAIAELLKKRKVIAHRYDGVRYDCGSKLGYLKANVDFGVRHPELGQAFAAYLRERQG
ncbi:UTP--glucose-1-phosphate uridylyltransferase GalU [Comamonas sp. BIGb0124]|uniref:UTP--glucose-1-phosphate uridylyltransferase GalU n=1 Tax=Comamonas sp. BIGb0124 TaxID=2485130 RepID=UPI000F49BC93